MSSLSVKLVRMKTDYLYEKWEGLFYFPIEFCFLSTRMKFSLYVVLGSRNFSIVLPHLHNLAILHFQVENS